MITGHAAAVHSQSLVSTVLDAELGGELRLEIEPAAGARRSCVG